MQKKNHRLIKTVSQLISISHLFINSCKSRQVYNAWILNKVCSFLSMKRMILGVRSFPLLVSERWSIIKFRLTKNGPANSKSFSILESNTFIILYILRKKKMGGQFPLPASWTFLVMLTENGEAHWTYVAHIDSLLVAKTPASFVSVIICRGDTSVALQSLHKTITYDARKSTPTGLGSCTKPRVYKSVAKMVFFLCVCAQNKTNETC